MGVFVLSSWVFGLSNESSVASWSLSSSYSWLKRAYLFSFLYDLDSGVEYEGYEWLPLLRTGELESERVLLWTVVHSLVEFVGSDFVVCGGDTTTIVRVGSSSSRSSLHFVSWFVGVPLFVAAAWNSLDRSYLELGLTFIVGVVGGDVKSSTGIGYACCNLLSLLHN